MENEAIPASKNSVSDGAISTKNAAAPSFKGALGLAFWPFLLSRLWVCFFAYWGQSEYARAGKYLQPFKGGWEGVPNWWFNPWTTYDAERFVHVAERGYDLVTSVSFPFYSILLLPFRHSEIAMAAWGVLLSNVAFLLALALLFQLTQRDFDREVATLSLWALAFFPATIVFSAVYSESVFLLFLLLTFWNARGGNWKWAAFWGLLAGLTRNSGPILCAALLVEYSMQCRSARSEGKTPPSRWKMLATLPPLLAFVGFQLYLRQTLGGSDLMLKQAHALGRDWMMPWTPLLKELYVFFFKNHVDVTTTVNLWTTLASVFLLFRFWRKGRFSYTVFLGGVMLAFLSYGVTYASYTVASVRYLAATFPVQQRLALTLRPVWKYPLFRGAIVALALFLSAWVAFAFGQKVYLF